MAGRGEGVIKIATMNLVTRTARVVEMGEAGLARPELAAMARAPLPRLVIADRMTDAEIDIVAAMQSGDAAAKRFWVRWVSAIEIQPDDPATVAGFAAVFGKARAADLLAEEEGIK